MKRLLRCRRPAPLVVAALICATLPALAQDRQGPSPDADARFAPLLDLARREIRETRTPGATIALVEGDRVVFTSAVGVSDVESGTPMRPDMLFRLGSTTKMFTAAALVTLAVQGRVALDVPMGSTVTGLDPALARLTAHQLLSHTAGLRDEAPMFGRHDDEALGAGVRAMKADMSFTEPTAIYSYSNPGYWIAGFVVEHVTKTPYADAMRELLFAPLGMARTTFRPTMAMTYPLASGHESPSGQPARVIRPAANNVATWPAGSMFSNVSDLARFAIAFMNNGQIDGTAALDPGVIAKLSSPQARVPGDTASYGYGLQLLDRGGHRVVTHGGSRAGYGSTIMMVPARRVAAIALGNLSGSGLPRTTRRGVEMLLNAGEGLLAPAETEAPASSSSQALAGWAGRYAQGPTNAIEIVWKDGALSVRSGKQELPARPQGSSRLRVGDGENASVLVLVPDRDGRPAYVFRGGRSFRRVQ